jgi:hypothetical protein
MDNGLEWTSDSPISTRDDIIRWWEARRYTFNAFLLAVGFASWLLVMTAGSAAVKPGEDFEEPMAMLSGTVISRCNGEHLLHAGMGCGHNLLQRTPTEPTLQIGTDFHGDPRRTARSLGCGSVAHNGVHRAKT